MMDAETELEEKNNLSILYDLLIYSEWKQEPELPAIPYQIDGLSSYIKSAVDYFRKQNLLEDTIGGVINWQHSWRMAIGDGGKVAAVIQDTCLEIRSSRDDYLSIVGKASLAKDPFPQWRRWDWSPDCTMLAIAFTNGTISVYDLLGSNLFNIQTSFWLLRPNKENASKCWGLIELCIHLVLIGTFPQLNYYDPKPKRSPEKLNVLLIELYARWNANQKCAARETNLETNLNIESKHTILYTANGRIPSVQTDSLLLNKSRAFAACFFLQTRVKTHKWSSELVVVDFSGTLQSYLVSAIDGFQESHTFSLARHHRYGVTAVTHHPKHNLLFVAGPIGSSTSPTEQDQGGISGITAWCILNDHPFYRVAHSDLKPMPFTDGIRNRFFRLTGRQPQSVIFRMRVSPSGRLMVALHSCGGISIWHLPSLRLFRFWPLGDQPNFDASNPLIEVPETKPKVAGSSMIDFYPVDVDWWSDQALVIARKSGAVSVCDVAGLRNMLGDSPEFLSGVPQIQTIFLERGFMGLECETELASKIDDEPSGSQSNDEIDDVSIDGKESSLVYRIFATLLYVITDIERFRPKRKRTRFFRRTYRLLALRSTTPDELYTRKLDNEEYETALSLAQQYGLDCDMVFQRQWRNSSVSSATIHDYLEKVSKRSWVLKECAERVPDTLTATKELLKFGLQVTDKDRLLSLGSDGDILHYGMLNKNQLELLRYRRKLLQYQDRLCTYEKILGGNVQAADNFDHVFYDKFRKSSTVDSCVRFARDCSWRAVEIILTFHGKEILDHWLPILANFPETFHPSNYKTLLPECSSEGSLFPWPEAEIREPDWSETEPYTDDDNSVTGTCDSSAELYDREPSLSMYRLPISRLTPEVVSQWYQDRVRTIERFSRMVDHALSLLRLGLERNIKGLESLQHHLLTLDALVYEVLLEDMTLASVEKATPDECCNLLMSKTSEATFVSDVRHILSPFLERCEKQSEGQRKVLLETYLVGLSAKSLVLPLKLFEAVRDQGTNWLDATRNEILSLALNCLYAYPSCDQLEIAQNIIETLPDTSSQNAETKQLRKQMKSLQTELKACHVLKRNGTSRPLKTVQALRNNPTGAVSLVVDMCHKISNGVSPGPLFADVLELQQTVFPCITRDKCFDIFAEALLTSGRPQCITRASTVLQCSPNQVYEVEFDKVPFERSRELILSAAKDYVDSAPALVCTEVELARACLRLMPDDPEVQKEIEFVASLESLHRFGLTLLPIQVRRHPDRLRLVISSVKQKPGSHRFYDQILQLAASLNVFDGDARALECQVLILVAEAAFKAQDFHYCAEMSLKLVQGSHASGWEITASLGRCSEYANISTKSKLLSFALAYCPADMIQELLLTQKKLEEETLKEKIAALVKMTNSQGHLDSVTSAQEDELDEQDSSSFLSSLGRIGEKTVTQTTNAVIEKVGDRQFWKNAFRIGWQENCGDSHSKLSPKPLEIPKCHSFYRSVLTKSEESVLSPSYDRLTAQPFPVNLQMCLALQRITLMEASHQGDILNVLSRCAQEILPEDNTLGLACLLQMPETVVEQTFAACPVTEISLALAKYFTAIKLFDETFRQECLSPRDVFCYNPNELVAAVKKIKDCSSPWLRMLLELDLKLTDLNEGEELLRLGSGIDLERFTQDPDYRRDSILGLAMNEEDFYMKTALKLGNRHGVPQAEIVGTHVVTILLSSLPPAEISTRLSEASLKQLMSTFANDIVQRLENDVWHCLSGDQHHNLQTCFTLLNDLRPGVKFGALLPKDHIKLLKKVRSVSKDIDYKKLVKGPDYILDAFYHSLTPETVVSVCKLAKALPSALGCRLTTSDLNRVCAEKLIENDKNLTLKTVSAVHTLLRRMTSEDVLSMVSSFCYPAGKSACWSIERNLQIIDICEDLSQEAGETDESWRDCFSIFCRWRDHCHILQPLMAIQPPVELFWQFYDTQGDSSAVSLVLRNAIHSDVSFDILFKLISTISGQYHVTLPGLLLKELLQFRSGGVGDILSGVLARLQQAEDAGISVVEPCLSALKELAANNDVDPNERVKVIALIQRSTQLDHASDSDLFWHQTEATIVRAWGRGTFNLFNTLHEDVKVEEKRSEIYLQLTKLSSTLAHCKALKTLIQLWPTIRIPPNNEDPAVFVITPCLQCDDGKWTEEKAAFLEEIFGQEKIDEKCVKDQVQNLRGGPVDVQLLILVTLLCKQRTLHLLAVSLIQQQLEEDLQERNVYLIIRRQLCSLLVTTRYYSHLVSVLLYSPNLHEERPGAISTLVNHLRARGCFAEAGSLLLAKSPPVPKSMRTFYGALVVASSAQPGAHTGGRSTPSSFQKNIGDSEIQKRR